MPSITVAGVVSAIHLETRFGDIDANLQGSTEIDGTIKTGNGQVHVALGRTASTLIECSVRMGTIQTTNLELDNASMGDKRLKGKLGTGEGQLELSSGFGSIELKE